MSPLLLLLACLCSALLVVAQFTPLPHVRPQSPKFTSVAVNSLIDDYVSRMANPDLATLFSNCFPNTLDTTVQFYAPSTPTSKPSAFIITGDIDAQWFRDSANQLLPYMSLAASDPALSDLMCGLILRHAADVTHDSFANSYNFNASGAGHQDDQRFPPMTKEVFEGKYELDSLAAVMKLASAYYNATGDAACFLTDAAWSNAMQRLLQTIQSMQAATSDPSASPYRFQRVSSTPTETQELDGMGPPTAYTGMSRSPFRPSDDATTFPYLIPAQAMTVVELRKLAAMIGEFKTRDESAQLSTDHALQLSQLQSVAGQLAAEIDAGIQQFGVLKRPGSGTALYAYEVDGFGSANLMDDANIPSLLSLPYLGYVSASDPVYQSTREFVWSGSQGFYWAGTAGRGIGGPHAGYGQIWPMSVVMFGMTSESDAEISWALESLVNSSAGTGFLHESFNKDDVTKFTRPWFAWVNGIFGEFILKLAKERPYLIFAKEADMQGQEEAQISLE